MDGELYPCDQCRVEIGSCNRRMEELIQAARKMGKLEEVR